jgi:hypothetical protein
MVLFVLTEAINSCKKSPKNDSKINLFADRRPFFLERVLYSVGCFNGCLSLSLPEKKKTLIEQVKVFHDSIYKKTCGCFNVFYNELFLSKLTPAFLDSCFMYKSGIYKNRYTKKLATLYGCEQQFLCSFESINLNQHFWEELSTFCHIRVKEPHKSNFNISFSLVMGEENELFAEWNSIMFSKTEIDDIFEKLVAVLRQLDLHKS